MVPTGNKTFASTAKVTGWKVGSSQKRGDVPDLTVEAGKMYYLDVGGTNAQDFPVEWRKLNGEIVTDVVNYNEE
jgi:hypothetical protein